MSSNILDDMFVTDIKSTIKKLHRRHTWKDYKKEPPGEPGVYLVKCVSKVDGSTYLINCCLFNGSAWDSGGIPDDNIAFWCEMPEDEVHI